jgi:hypothetical protein
MARPRLLILRLTRVPCNPPPNAPPVFSLETRSGGRLLDFLNLRRVIVIVVSEKLDVGSHVTRVVPGDHIEKLDNIGIEDSEKPEFTAEKENTRALYHFRRGLIICLQVS